MNDQPTRRDQHPAFADHVVGFAHPTLASCPSYRRFREVLADLIDESDAALGRTLSDVRNATISSPFGAPCPTCRATSWPIRANRRGDTFVGDYECACGKRFRASHDIADVDWHNGRP